MTRNPEKYKGVIPAFYACYDEKGAVSPDRTRMLARHLIGKGVKGLYLCGSSGECIYQSVAERKLIAETVIEEAAGKATVIVHVACNNTKDSVELAVHAAALGADAIAAIPPIYFRLPEHAIAEYWNAISAGAPQTDFIIYNIPQLAGVALTPGLLEEMLKNPRVIGVKNSSMPVQDIQTFKAIGGKGFIVFNGPDEQFVGGLAIGADGGIGGTYAVMPELFLAMEKLFRNGEAAAACEIQNDVNEIIGTMCKCRGNLYAVMKEIIKRREGLDIGSVRAPLAELSQSDEELVTQSMAMINHAIVKLA